MSTEATTQEAPRGGMKGSVVDITAGPYRGDVGVVLKRVAGTPVEAYEVELRGRHIHVVLVPSHFAPRHRAEAASRPPAGDAAQSA